MTPELEIILPIHPSVPSIWELAAILLTPGVLLLLVLGLFFWWKSEPISDEEVRRVLRER